MSASWALQQAVHAALATSGEVQDAVGERIFDHVPRDAAFPYVVVGDDAVRDAGTATEAGSEHLIAIQVWSRAKGLKECKAAAETVRLALDQAELDIGGYALIGLRHTATDFAREPDGETLRASVTFRAVLEPN